MPEFRFKTEPFAHQREAFERFKEMMWNIQANTVSRFFHVQLRDEVDAIRKTLRYEEEAP